MLEINPTGQHSHTATRSGWNGMKPLLMIFQKHLPSGWTVNMLPINCHWQGRSISLFRVIPATFAVHHTITSLFLLHYTWDAVNAILTHPTVNCDIFTIIFALTSCLNFANVHNITSEAMQCNARKWHNIMQWNVTVHTLYSEQSLASQRCSVEDWYLRASSLREVVNIHSNTHSLRW